MNRSSHSVPSLSGNLIAYLVTGGFVTAMAVACREPETAGVVHLTHSRPAFYHPKPLKALVAGFCSTRV